MLCAQRDFRLFLAANSYPQELPVMPDVVVLGFPRSTFVHIARLALTHKQVPYTFRDLEPEMGSATHLALHPFNRVPILQHGDFTLYETSAIAAYVDEAFDGPALQPKDVRARARMNQWISAVNSYYYPYMIYHVSHERRGFSQLRSAADEKEVARAVPHNVVSPAVLEHELGDGKDQWLGPDLTLADFYVLPSTYAFGLTKEDRACIRNTRPSADGGRGWRHIRPCESFVPRCRRTLPSSMRGNGRFRIGLNTDGHAAAFGCNANGGSHEMDHARARQGRPGRLPMADQKIRRRGRGVHFRSTRQGGERGQTPERHPLRREKRRIGAPRQGVLVRGDLEKVQVDR